MIIALIDGDWIMYAAGFAGQRTEMVCPSLSDKTYANITEIRKDADDPKLSPTRCYSRVVIDQESHFYHSAKCMIENNCQKIAEKFNCEVKPRVMIDGDGNFRSKLARIRPYKGTRSVHAKPLMYNNVRAYLLDVWEAETIYDQESDDAMAIAQTEYTGEGISSVIVSVDKDMIQVPGWHLNPNKGFKQISEREGLERLYVQAIQGDTTDNIAGCYKAGPKAARAAITSDMSEADMWDKTIAMYEASVKKHGKVIYNGLTGQEAAVENMRLVYLRRHKDELWTPPEK